MASKDGSLVMAFNGEIYNSPELRTYCESKGCQFRSRMDGEVILQLWKLEGLSCLRRLNGIFALAIADTRAGQVTLARDPLGVKPLVYSVADDGSVMFASELRALHELGVELGSPDPLALAQFLTFLWVPDPATPYAKARTVEPGGAIICTTNGIQPLRWGPPLEPDPEPAPIDERQVIEQGAAEVRAAVQRQMLSDVPVGLMASGGVDSGLVWWGARDLLERAYTITWDRAGAEKLDEDARAVELCERRFQTPVRYLPGEEWDRNRLPPSGDLLADPAYELTRCIASSASLDGCKVLLSGQGGDEIFGGYRRHQVARLLELTPNWVAKDLRPLGYITGPSPALDYAGRMARALSRPDPFHRYLALCSYSDSVERAMVLGTTEAEVGDELVWSRHLEVQSSLSPHLSLLRKVMTVDLRVYLPGLGLTYVDRAAMEHGVEVRVPLLDLDLVRWSLTLPDELLIRRGRSKWLAKQLALRVMPEASVQRPKRGFAVPATYLTGQSRHSAKVAGPRQAAYFLRAAELVRLYAAGGVASSRTV